MITYSRQTLLLTWRSLRAIPRVPERLLDVTIQPVVFILLFLYVFGSAIHPGIPYKDFLFPGIIAQSMAFGIFGAGTATAHDMSEGVIDRFKSMPVSRISILSGQVLGQMAEQMLGIVITVGLGLALGWAPKFNFVHGLELVGLILLSLTAFTWIGVLFGLIVRVPDAVQGIGFVIVFPLSFMAGTFVPIAGMDPVFRTIGEWEPISAFVAAVRGLTTPGARHVGGSWELAHAELSAALWCVILIAIAVPLALRRFNTRIA
jgi:ABC-type multidrug transport system permease subunit